MRKRVLKSMICACIEFKPCELKVLEKMVFKLVVE